VSAPSRNRVEGHFVAVISSSSILAVVTPGSRTARGRCREAQTDEIVGRFADDRLIEVANLNLDVSRRTSEPAQITDVAIAANQTGGPSGNVPLFSPSAIRRISRYSHERKHGTTAPS